MTPAYLTRRHIFVGASDRTYCGQIWDRSTASHYEMHYDPAPVAEDEVDLAATDICGTCKRAALARIDRSRKRAGVSGGAK